MTINISVPKTTVEAPLQPRITVVGIGGAGGNAVNNMIQSDMKGVDFLVANTDAQALCNSRTDRRIQLGRDTTQGLGAGARPEVGRHSAEEAMEMIARELEGAHMAFITAGMGGGTGTGAAPVIARIAREMGVLTVGVVTKPFHFEGVHRMRLAEAGIEELAAYVDTLIVIPNQNLFRVANEKTTFADAFKMADDVLHSGVRSVTDLMMMPGMINLDFADVRTVMKEMGRAMMGTGEASGDRRALDAAEAAIANPLLEETSMKGAKGVLINITGGMDITLFEVDEAANRIKDEVETDAHIIFGSCFDEALEGKIRVSVVATGIEAVAGAQPRPVATRTETRAVGRRLPDIRSAAPTTRSPVTAPMAASVAAAPAPASAAQASFGQFNFGSTLAPATGTMDLQAEERALMEITAAVRDAEAEAAAVELPPMMVEQPAAAPMAAQAAAVAEAVANAPAAAAPRVAPVAPVTISANVFGGAPAAPRDVFVARAPVEPRIVESRPSMPEFRMEAPEMKMSMAEPVKAAAPAPAPQPKPEPARVSLFGRYRSLTSRPKDEAAKDQARDQAPRAAAPMAPAQPQPQAKVERPGAMNVAIAPQDRPLTSHDEDELEIPAFLRRQAN